MRIRQSAGKFGIVSCIFVWFSATPARASLVDRDALQQGFFTELLQTTREVHNRLWSKTPLVGDEKKSVLATFESAENELSLIHTNLQSELLEWSQNPLSKTIQQAYETSSQVGLYFRALNALSTVKAQIKTSDRAFSVRDYLNGYALFVPHNIYASLAISSQIEATSKQDYFVNFEVGNFRLQGLSGVKLNANPFFMISSELNYLFQKDFDTKKLLLAYKYVAYRNLLRQWSWLGFMLDDQQRLPINLTGIHSIDILTDMDTHNGEQLILSEAKGVIAKEIRSLQNEVPTFSSESIQKMAIENWISSKDANTRSDLAKHISARLQVSPTQAVPAFELFLDSAAINLATMPSRELRKFITSTFARAYGAQILQKAIQLHKELRFADEPKDQKLSASDRDQLYASISAATPHFETQMNLLLEERFTSFEVGSENYDSLRAYLQAKTRDQTFRKLIRTAINGARIHGDIASRWSSVLLTLKNEVIQSLNQKKMVVPKSMDEALDALALAKTQNDIKSLRDSGVQKLTIEQKQLLREQELANQRQTKNSATRLLPSNEIKHRLNEIEQALVAWNDFSQIFSLNDPRFTSLNQSNILSSTPEEMLRSPSPELTARRLGLQKSNLARAIMAEYPVLQHQVPQGEQTRPLYMVIYDSFRNGSPYNKVVASIVQALRASRTAIASDTKYIEGATSLYEMDDLAKSPGLNKELKYLFPQFGILQRHWIDDIGVGNTFRRHYESSMDGTRHFVLMPLLALMLSEFLADGTKAPGTKGNVVTLRRAFTDNWRSSIHPWLWGMLIGNMLYGDSESLYRYGLGYRIDVDWENAKIALNPSTTNQRIEALGKSNVIGHSLIDEDYLSFLSERLQQEQIGNQVALAWDALLLYWITKPSPPKPTYEDWMRSWRSDSGGGVRVPQPPGPPGLPPSKLMIDLETGEIRGFR